VDVEETFFCDVSCRYHRPLVDFMSDIRSFSELCDLTDMSWAHIFMTSTNPLQQIKPTHITLPKFRPVSGMAHERGSVYFAS